MTIKEVMFLFGTEVRGLSYLQMYKRKRVSVFIIDETVIQIGTQHFWLWFCIEPIHSFIIGIYSSVKRKMLVAKKFVKSLVSKNMVNIQFILIVVFGILKSVRY